MSVESSNGAVGLHPLAAHPEGEGRLTRVWREETAGLCPRYWLANVLPRLLPPGVGYRVRCLLYRLVGMSVGRGTLLGGPITLGSAPGSAGRIRIGDDCYLNQHVYIDAADQVSIGNGVSIGHHVVIITSDHEIGPPGRRAGAMKSAPVRVEDGAWIAAGATLLPGVTVGKGAVVAAGAVVARDVPPNTLVGGVPARFLRSLETE